MHYLPTGCFCMGDGPSGDLVYHGFALLWIADVHCVGAQLLQVGLGCFVVEVLNLLWRPGVDVLDA